MTILGRSILAVAGLAATVAVAAVATAQQSPQQVIEARQNAMKSFGAEMKAIGDGAKAGSLSKDEAVMRSKKLNDLANQAHSWFPRGSGPESGVKTRALPAIWEKPADYRAAIDKFGLETAKLVAAAETGQNATVAAQHGEVGKACGACHNGFRARQ
ncbi:MAG: cytochrome c [Alphaproteobacteria bacterium]